MTNPIPVEITKWTPTTYGVWSLVIVQCFVVIGLVIKKGPEWLSKWMDFRKQDAEIDANQEAARATREATDAARLAAEKLATTERIDHLESRMSQMVQAVSFLMNAAITSTNALETAVPGSPAIKQSRDLIALAASSIGGDDPFSKALAQLASSRGVGE